MKGDLQFWKKTHIHFIGRKQKNIQSIIRRRRKISGWRKHRKPRILEKGRTSSCKDVNGENKIILGENKGDKQRKLRMMQNQGEKRLKRTFLSLNKQWFRNTGAHRNNKDIKENWTKEGMTGKENGGSTIEREWDMDWIEIGGRKSNEKSPHSVFR